MDGVTYNIKIEMLLKKGEESIYCKYVATEF